MIWLFLNDRLEELAPAIASMLGVHAFFMMLASGSAKDRRK